MNTLDIIFCIPLLWAAYNGFKKGLVIEITSLLARGLGIYGATKFSNFVGDFLVKEFELSTNYISIISFVITFLGIVICVYIIGKTVERIVDMVALKMINKVFGLIFGVLKVGLILSVLVMIVQSFDTQEVIISSKIKADSILYQPIAKLASIAVPAIQDSEWLKQF
jgi:membrane protein required for colicin V production